jgi:hypothetical protein
MPTVAFENIPCGSRPFRFHPVPPNETPSYPNWFRLHVVSWDRPSSQLYKYVKVAGIWRYCKSAYHENNKIKPDIVFVKAKQARLEKHPEGRYYMSHNGQWLDAGTDALEALRKRKQRLALDEFNRLSGKGSAKSAVVLRTTMAGSHRATISASPSLPTSSRSYLKQA